MPQKKELGQYSQQGRLIAYMSRALGVTKRSWSAYAKEMLAKVEAIRLWRPYILGHKFYILTDQRSLKFFLEQQIATPEQQKWVAKLLGYDYEILYRPGRENSTADALSRRVDNPTLQAIFTSQLDVWDDIRRASLQDSYVQIMTNMAAEKFDTSVQVRDGLLLYKGRIVVPTDPDIRRKLLYEMHDSKSAGHSGVLRTYKRLKKKFYWPHMYKAVQQYGVVKELKLRQQPLQACCSRFLFHLKCGMISHSTSLKGCLGPMAMT